MRFIESIVFGIQVHRHNRHVSIPGTVGGGRYSIDFQFLDDVALVCAARELTDPTSTTTTTTIVWWKGLVSSCALPLFPQIH